jgi:hypothetical protein
MSPGRQRMIARTVRTKDLDPDTGNSDRISQAHQSGSIFARRGFDVTPSTARGGRVVAEERAEARGSQEGQKQGQKPGAAWRGRSQDSLRSWRP